MLPSTCCVGEYQALVDLGADLVPDQWDTPTCLPGWTVRDVLSHVIGTEAGMMGEPAPDVDISHLAHMRNPIAEANELWVESLRGTSGPEMVARLEEVTGRRLAELDAMDQDAFDAPSWTPAGRDETYGRFMRIRHYDCYLHEQDIRLALGMAVRETVATWHQPSTRSPPDWATSSGAGQLCPKGHGCGST